MVARAEGLLQDLGLQYRVLDLCAGDMGISAARTFDLEVYSPGVRPVAGGLLGQLVHATTRPAGPTSATGPTGGGGPVLVHTLNGSALAWARIWAALVETGPPGRRVGGAARGAGPLPPGRGGHPRAALADGSTGRSADRSESRLGAGASNR